VQLTLGPVISDRQNKTKTKAKRKLKQQLTHNKYVEKTVRNALENQSQQTLDLVKVICHSF